MSVDTTQSLSQLFNSRSLGSSLVFIFTLAVIAFWIARARADFDDPTLLKKLVAEGALLVDVRSPSEYQSGHISGAINIPVGEVAQRLKEFGDPKKAVIVYCRSGARSARAQATLKEQGFTQVYNLGGIGRWPQSPTTQESK